MQNDSKKTKKRENARMTGTMLRHIRQEMKLPPRDMRSILVPPGQPAMPRRTYEDYEAGKRSIPAALATRIRELHQEDREFMAGIAARVDAAESGEKQ